MLSDALISEALSPVDLLYRIRRWATLQPDALALRHKRRGRWKAWRWWDVAHEVDALGAHLRAEGVGAHSRVALCGAFEPTLILVAVAARAQGAELVPVALSGDDPATLATTLREAAASHVFLQRREDVSRYRAWSAHEQPSVRLLGIAARETAPGVQSLRERRGAQGELVWVDEGSEWREGLEVLLRHWLDTGTCLAFPERVESATRDRRDIAPTALLLSAARLDDLTVELESRLAPRGSLRRRLSDWALREGISRGGLRRHLHARLRSQFGLHRVQSVLHARPVGAASAWLGSGQQGHLNGEET